MPYYSDYYTVDVVRNSLTTLWQNVADFLPRFIAALVVFFVGWILAVVVGKLVWHLVKFLQIDRGLESVGLKKVWERSGHKLDSALFFYELVKWAVIIGFLMAATEILGLTQVSEFLRTVAYYIPNVFVAAIILMIGVLVARFIEGLVRASMRAATLASANTLGALSRWIVLVFSFLIALEQLQIGTATLQIALWGVIGAAAIAFGLAFGLGGRDHASDIIARWRKRIEE